MCSFQEKNIISSLPLFYVPTLQTAHGNFLILFQMDLLPNINFLSSKQNRRPKIDLKILKQ